ncbi:MAG TPA: amidase family protein [Candidatus Dormibacteraeota bacterium]|nr:amidase family protein [Candidatus Dormibacteraeota bacterium]
MTLSAVELVSAVRSGELSAQTATERALLRIEELDGSIGAFQKVRALAAIRDAQDVDARPDKMSLPLAGLPIAVKDNVPVEGEPMRCGSTASDPTPQPADHEVVRRLRAAGAVVVGLTRVPELCVFGATDSRFGVTRNPWNHSRTPGGSSGGSAAAVAAGMVAVAHGNDGMGSIRIPAACCGLVGLKPGRGLVPSALGNGSWFDMAENGALATSVDDCALLLSVMAGRRELATVAAPAGVRVAVSPHAPAPFTPVDRHWSAAARRTGMLLRDAGHQVTTARPPYGQRTALSEMVRWVAGTELDARLLASPSALEPRTRRHAQLGRVALRLGLPREQGRARWRSAAERFFADHDVLVTPALAQPPIEAAAWGQRGWLANILANIRYAPFAAPWNLAGWPAMVVPAGLHPDGMPLAVQLVGRPGSEAMLLGVAHQLEALRPWPRTAPAYA